jgi:hypothetical protein
MMIFVLKVDLRNAFSHKYTDTWPMLRSFCP